MEPSDLGRGRKLLPSEGTTELLPNGRKRRPSRDDGDGGTERARPSRAAANTNRKGYSRPVVSESSVNVIANPVRVAPIPKVIAHVPTNIIITTPGVGLSLIKVAMPNAVTRVARNAKARPTAM